MLRPVRPSGVIYVLYPQFSNDIDFKIQGRNTSVHIESFSESVLIPICNDLFSENEMKMNCHMIYAPPPL